MKNRIDGLVIKSYIKKKDVCIYMIIISIVTMLIINVLNTSLFISGENLKKYAKEQYGLYKYQIYEQSYDLVNKIKNDPLVYEAAYSQSYLTEEEYVLSCEEGYLKLLGIDVIKGKFPVNENEIMCNVSYLYSLGYKYDEMIGATVNINDTNYIVTGLVAYGALDEFEFTGRIIVYNIKFKDLSLKYEIAVNTKSDNFNEEKNKVLKKYNISKEYYIDNGAYLHMANRNNEDKPILLLKAGYIILWGIIFAMLFLTNSIIFLIFDRIKKINSVYYRIGLKKDKIFKCLIKTFSIFYVVSTVICIATSFVVSEVYSFDNKRNFLLSGLKLNIIYALVLAAYTIYLIRKKIYKENVLGYNLANKKIVRKNTLMPKENLYSQIADNIKVFSKVKKFIMILPLVFSGLLFIVSLYYIYNAKTYFKETNPYDYQLIYKGNDVDLYQIDDYNCIIEDLEEEINADNRMKILPVYLNDQQLVYIKRSALSSKYINVLKNSDIEIKKQVDRQEANIYTKIAVLAMDEKYIDQIGIDKNTYNLLNDGECILISKVNSYGLGKIKTGLQKHDKIKLNLYDNGKQKQYELNIVDVYDDIDLDIENDNNLIKIFVSKDWFLKNYEASISYSFPRILYLKTNGNEEIINSVKGYPSIYIKDINENNKEIESYTSAVYTVAFLIISLVMIITMLNIIMIIVNRMYDIKKVSNILKIVGVRDSKIIKVFIYDIRKIFLSSYIVTTLISMILCYPILTGVDVNIVEFVRYYYPYKYLLALGIIYFVLYQFLILIFRNKIVNGEIMRELKEENE